MGIRLSVDLTNFTRLSGVSDRIKAVVSKLTMEAHNFIAKYPPPPRGSKYRRTGTLGRNWSDSVTFTRHEVTGYVSNVTPYAPYVQSLEKQAKVHRGRWRTIEDAVQFIKDKNPLGLFSGAVWRGKQ